MPVRTPVTMPLDSADRSRIASRVNGGRIIVDRAILFRPQTIVRQLDDVDHIA
ncbi:hypothetical protein X737_27840 [Mesorhizobium sp. L48C026A00]|nr:hypothetical protein X737_27840 [Mesorhizobium sp. L48C026A00]